MGWLIRQKDAHLFSRTPPNDAPAEGAAAAWVRLGIQGGGHVDMAAVYLNGTEKEAKRDEILEVLKAAPQQRRLVMGDVNRDMRRVNDESGR